MSVTIAMLGSPHTGKTALLHTYLFNIFPSFYTSTNGDVLLALGPPRQTYFDLPGSLTTSDRLSLHLAGASVFIICFSLMDRQTLEAVERHWCPLAQHYNTNAKLLLVGCMKDLRPRLVELGGAVVPAEEGRLLAGKLGAKYWECSAMTEEGVKAVFTLAVELGLGRQLMEGETVGGWDE